MLMCECDDDHQANTPLPSFHASSAYQKQITLKANAKPKHLVTGGGRQSSFSPQNAPLTRPGEGEPVQKHPETRPKTPPRPSSDNERRGFGWILAVVVVKSNVGSGLHRKHDVSTLSHGGSVQKNHVRVLYIGLVVL